MDAFSQFYHDELVRDAEGNLEARNSELGWIVRGKVDTADPPSEVLKVTATHDQTAQLLKRYWEIEDLSSQSSPYTAEEEAAVDHFNSTVERTDDGHYSVQLPRKSPTPELGDSYSLL